MCNQAFQIACCIAYALRNGLEYHIPAHTLNDSVWKPMFTHLENPKWNPELPQIKVKEKSHSYIKIPDIFDMPSFIKEEAQWDGKDFPNLNIIIDGYRQSLKYFEDYLPEVRKAFGFDYIPNKKDTCSIQVRRGDYLQHPTKHPVVTYEYLIRAINKMTDEGYESFLFHSDDICWCKEFVDVCIYPDWLDFKFSENKTELQDFQSMLNCGSFIISNSTFSLMAAILSENPNKIVISPDESNWFGENNRHLSVVDLIPKEYIRIKY